MDHAAKIFELPRSDALLAFAGDTSYAYPLAAHLITSISIYPRSADRRYPLARAKGHVLRVFDQVYRAIHSFPVGQLSPLTPQPDVHFLLGGFSWHDNDFQMWNIVLNPGSQRFEFRPGRSFLFIGSPGNAVADAINRTHQLLASRGRSPTQIDMEPFEALRDICRAGSYSEIGGAPQVAKVYRHMNTQFFATLWPQGGAAAPHVFGRPIISPETCCWPTFDPDAMDFLA